MEEKNKPFLGGYRDRIRKTEYHHAIAQTNPVIHPRKEDVQCRETQTICLKNVRTQGPREASTQMTKIGVYVSTTGHKVLVAQKVPTVDEWLAVRLKKIILLQSYWRRWLAQRRVGQLFNEKHERERIERELQESLVKEKEQLLHTEFRRKLRPKNKSDFDLVYKTIEDWRQRELTKINEAFDGPERKAMLCKHHKDEVAFLSAVESLKNVAREEGKERARLRLLKNVSKPIEFPSSVNGKPTFMETVWITRASELVSLYRSLIDKRSTKSERLDILLSVTITVSEFVCDLTSEISGLIDREVTMLTTGTKMADHVFDGIRTRTANLFLEFLKNPLFNPQVARFLPTTQETDKMPEMYFCSSCKRHWPIGEFLDPNARTLICKDCEHVKNIGNARYDMGFYRNMLRDLQKSETTQSGRPDLPLFAMSANDLKYLLESVWHISSIVSGRRDIYDLKFVRWDRNTPWTPWNCILLTREEAVVHLRKPNVKVYSDALTDNIALKHRLARSRFDFVTRSMNQTRIMKIKSRPKSN